MKNHNHNQNQQNILLNFNKKQTPPLPVSFKIIEKDLYELPLSILKINHIKRYSSDCFYHKKEELFSFFIVFYNENTNEIHYFIIIFLLSFPYVNPYVYYSPSRNRLKSFSYEKLSQIPVDKYNFIKIQNFQPETWTSIRNLSIIVYTLELLIDTKNNKENQYKNQVESIEKFNQDKKIYEFALNIDPLFDIIPNSLSPKMLILENMYIFTERRYDIEYLLNSIIDVKYFNNIKLAEYVSSIYDRSSDDKSRIEVDNNNITKFNHNKVFYIRNFYGFGFNFDSYEKGFEKKLKII